MSGFTLTPRHEGGVMPKSVILIAAEPFTLIVPPSFFAE
jgi:hypothetical protein